MTGISPVHVRLFPNELIGRLRARKSRVGLSPAKPDKSLYQTQPELRLVARQTGRDRLSQPAPSQNTDRASPDRTARGPDRDIFAACNERRNFRASLQGR